jgi:SMC interacting uncharacterized protein involved in chromosome segregation
MKTQATFFTILLFLLAFSCDSSLERQVNELHDTSRQIEKEVVPKLENLSQQKNSINIRGRALTPEEIEFTGKVDALEQTYADWQKGMEKAEQMKPTKERLRLEQTLKNAIAGFQKQVEALVPKPSL